MCIVPACHGSLICCDMSFTFFFLKKKFYFYQCFLFSQFFIYFICFDFSYLFIYLDCLGRGGPCSLEGTVHCLLYEWFGLQIWVTSPFLPVPWRFVEGETAGLGSIPLSICLPVCCDCWGCSWEGEGVHIPFVALYTTWAGTKVVTSWEHGPHALSVWTVSIFWSNFNIVL